MRKAYVGAQIHDGMILHNDHALVMATNGLFSIQPRVSLPEDCPLETLQGGMIMPCFVDLQVNGGGGIMFNEDQSVATLSRIAAAHTAAGTGGILATLITDTPARAGAAIAAVERGIADGVDGLAGLHLEGPHLAIARKGAHDPNLIRKMNDDDLAILLNAADRIANVMVTVAPENTTCTQIRTMADAGIVVSLGHTNADMETCLAAFDAGARCVTHLFNAMSQLGNRDPGLVGATLSRPEIYAGLIADGLHVHPTTIRIALAANPQPDRVFLVTDAMATAGSPIDQFSINGRDVFRNAGRLTLKDGTLAGADLDMSRAIDVMTDSVADTLADAVKRASSTPAGLLREAATLGTIGGACSKVLYINKTSSIRAVLDGTGCPE